MAQASLTKPHISRSPRLAPALAPGVVVVGASTGGPQALVLLIREFAPALATLPLCVSLHLPADLMPVVAAHLSRACGVATAVVHANRRLEPGTVYLAPGDRHLAFRRSGAATELVLPPVLASDLCRPSIDVMFMSAATCFGSRVIGVVLSGMGKDGLAGAQAIVAAGGAVLVQDRPSSAVWGMPGAVAKAELAAAVLDPAAIGREIAGKMARGRSLA